MRALSEAALAASGDERTWALGVSTVASGLVEAVKGVGVQLVEHDEAMRFSSIRTHGLGTADGALHGDRIETLAASLPAPVLRELYYPQGATLSLSYALERIGQLPMLEVFGATEVCVALAHPAENQVVGVFFDVAHRHDLTAHERRMLGLASLHLGVGAAARAVGGLAGWVSVDGRLLEGAPGTERRLWPGVCSGRYSLVPRVGFGGRSYSVLEHAPAQWPVRRLTTLEREVLERSARGVPGKRQALELGVAATTVSQALGLASAKIGIAHPFETIRVVAGLVRATARVDVEGLSAAERDVLGLVRRGLPNRQIALERGRSERTVANQIASLLRKTGLASRRALIAASVEPEGVRDAG